ncbi:MAG: ABC transporter substrate-binding protein [Asticcacaulis sp.]
MSGKKHLGLCALAVLAGLMFDAGSAMAAPRVISIDECADQYALGLLPSDRIAAVSDHAALDDSYYADRARGFRRVRPSIEALLALHPDVVVRTWGGDAKLIAALERNNIKVVNINDVHSYAEAREELLRVGQLLDQDNQAAIEARAMSATLDGVRHIGKGKTVLYYTPTGYSAGGDTFTGEMLKTLGYTLYSADNGYFPLRSELVLSEKPDVFALGFYDDRFQSRRAPGRNGLVRSWIRQRPHIALPARMLTCAGWYTAYDLEAVSRQPSGGGFE